MDCLEIGVLFMFYKFKRRYCKLRYCTGKERNPLTGETYCNTSKWLCGICDHTIFDPCGTCAFYHDCNLHYKDKSLF